MRHRLTTAVALAAALASITVGLGAPPSEAADTVAAEGDLMPFGAAGGPVDGQVVRVLEDPTLSTTTDAGGHWRIEGIPVGSAATFAVDLGDRYPIQTATFTMGAADLTRVSFQSPSHAVVDALEALLGIESDPTRCHIASTVTRRGYSLYVGGPDGTHGEPGATVTIDPTPDAGTGPIYFNGSRFDVIWPDPALDETTADGGVLFTNVSPGTYTLRAHKAGAVIREVTVGCRAGVLTNASPPWGLQVVDGGLDLDDTVPFPSPTTTTLPTTSVPSTSGPATTVPAGPATTAPVPGAPSATPAATRATVAVPTFTG